MRIPYKYTSTCTKPNIFRPKESELENPSLIYRQLGPPTVYIHTTSPIMIGVRRCIGKNRMTVRHHEVLSIVSSIYSSN